MIVWDNLEERKKKNDRYLNTAKIIKMPIIISIIIIIFIND